MRAGNEVPRVDFDRTFLRMGHPIAVEADANEEMLNHMAKKLAKP